MTLHFPFITYIWKLFRVLIKFQSTLSVYILVSWFIQPPIFYTFSRGHCQELAAIGRMRKALTQPHITDSDSFVCMFRKVHCHMTRLFSSDSPHQRWNWYIQPLLLMNFSLGCFTSSLVSVVFKILHCGCLFNSYFKIKYELGLLLINLHPPLLGNILW